MIIANGYNAAVNFQLTFERNIQSSNEAMKNNLESGINSGARLLFPGSLRRDDVTRVAGASWQSKDK